VFGSQTLLPGSAITVGGDVISADPDGNIVVNPAPATTTPAGVVVIGGSSITANGDNGFVIGSQTLFPGSAITVAVNGASPTTLLTSASPITSLIIAGQTLTQGGRVTVGGDILSLAPSGTGIVVIGTVTIGGGESTATATASGKKKNAAGQNVPILDFTLAWVGLYSIFFFSLGALWMH
ncbi:hypothetical protein B0O99DRAFT_498833, partial [Bisporella sp. PMI_857]